MRRAVIATGSLAAANSLIGGLLPPDSDAAQVAPNDRDVLTHNVSYEGKAGLVAGYLARPMKAGQFPGLLVIHENRGLDDHVCDVARRFAKAGYVALASDFLSRQGGTMKANPKAQAYPTSVSLPRGKASQKMQKRESGICGFFPMFAATG